ncbi:MAG: potassium transporter Trk [Microbacterium sp. 69-7]|jgi:hypothetical protein|uniref:Potassium transporter Trk n=1 Tax=Microbacterium laevaniformans TaxID=36807 RepID=A0A150HJB8_9MICO|nr:MULTISPECIES: hypothetical protein [Microbacterium]EPD85755.1 hypothetical protein HMPREF1529_00767 [Microbacterium sp. oral taxon 186 str. F0373]KXZ61928.1 hypothetical protein Mlaev_00135 [Microbacterium laevaniformans]ODT23832.1 MAG: potassium transporter Trk [Microbacterium sp. SCN 69-37]OJU44171.1 MAG: potassium transporter Trk [Microbacterium sp. 69-7]
MSPSDDRRIETAQVRRSPRYTVFLLAGAFVGILAALVLTFAFGGDNESASTGVSYSTTQVFGFICLFAIPIGVAVGGVVALVLDRSLARRAHEVRVEREVITIDDAE